MRTSTEMATQAAKGDWALPIEAVIDAQGVFAAVTSLNVKLPLEESLIAIVMAVREQFSIGLLRRLWWCATEDMLSNVLTKGSVKERSFTHGTTIGQWLLSKETI